MKSKLLEKIDTNGALKPFWRGFLNKKPGESIEMPADLCMLDIYSYWTSAGEENLVAYNGFFFVDITPGHKSAGEPYEFK